MPHVPTKSRLTAGEKAVIKALLNDGLRNQDIQALINTGRAASINFGRISGIKADKKIEPATEQQVEAFRYKKLHFDHVTGLCPFDDERIVRAREAMILAVELFNTPRIAFKAGVFAMLANVSWTYLMLHYYESKKIQIVKDNDFTLSLSEMLARADCPVSDPIKKNLSALKIIRDVVEHRSIGQFDRKYVPIFQSTCLNFEKTITALFGPRMTLGSDLGFSLQFAKLGQDEIAALQGFDLPPHIAALDANLAANLADGDSENLEYQFKVVYTLTSASKSKANFQFILPDSDAGQEISNVLIKFKPKDDFFKLKPSDVVAQVRKGSNRRFTQDTHQRAWKMYKVRPRGGTENPAATNAEYCHYDAPYNSYTYTPAWVNFLLATIADDASWQALKTFKEEV
jgi:hypothetical protein